ncbi:MAG TPA: anhydro-N-acetylmuramic acid kinase [Ignavibacteriaceae bacterium]|jgi:anhydro-N-acetylmuramic acid kinase|nr:anhydro-N-acetylmuramic acid kinase [Ignavibacteriaceae bacterium]
MSIKKLLQLNKKKKRIVAGLMSGTSLDGVDVAILEIRNSGRKTKLKDIGFFTYPFPDGMKEMILSNAVTNAGNVTDICKLNFLISRVYADAIKELCRRIEFPLSKIDLIGSHGQTIHHLPKKDEQFEYSTASTLQIGDPSVLAKLTGITTVGDFRVADVALGGEGAPLVPYFDFIMYTSKKVNRALLNIGGISNITILKKNCKTKDVIAFDTGPGNMLIDYLVKKFYNKEYDKDGEIALSGKINEELLRMIFEKDELIKKVPPKSSGREYFDMNFLEPLIEKFPDVPKEDLIATITDYTAYSVWVNYSSFIKSNCKIKELFLSGGGSKNKAIINSLQKYFGEKVKIKNVEELGISADAKEAICFAVLANETIAGNSANITSVTGAAKETILGKICLP